MDCKLWTGAVSDSGYGTIRVSGKTILIHREAYEVQRGPIPHGLEIDHTCRNKLCYNPDHLEAVTHQENMRRWSSTLKCGCGKEFDRNWGGRRQCKDCSYRRKAKYVAKKKREKSCIP